MSWLRRVRPRLGAFLRRPAVEAEMDEELRSHVERQARQNLELGMTETEARQAALRRFGWLESVKESCREERGVRWLENLLQDVRYGLRILRRNPGFAAAAVVTLGLGVGATTAIFSVVNAVLLRPPPYPHPDRLERLVLRWNDGSVNSSFTVPELVFHRERDTAFETIVGFRGGGDLSLRQGDDYQWLASLEVTDGFFATLGANPALGREFSRAETVPGTPGVVVLSDRLWRTSFGADPTILGRQIVLDREGYTVVGVTPPAFSFAEQPADLYLALKLGRTLSDQGMNTEVIARLKPGASRRDAQAQLAVVFDQFRKSGQAPERQRGVDAVRYQDWLASDVRLSLLLLFLAVSLLLLISAANVASLLLARAAARQREICIRLAQGASRARLLAQFLSESLLLAVAGGAAGLTAASWTLKTLASSIPWDVPAIREVRLDGTVLLFAVLVVCGTSLVFGLVSFWQASKFELHAALKEGTAQAGRTVQGRLRSALVMGQVALSLILMIGAGLLISSLHHLRRERLGFDSANVMTLTTPFDSGRYATTEQMWAFERQVLDQFESLPGVASAAVVSVPPLMGKMNLPTQHAGVPEDSIGGMECRAISPHYFQTLRIPVLRGRALAETDSASAQPVVVINETLARRWWAAKDPIGDRLVIGQFRGQNVMGPEQPPRTVIGVVADVKGRAMGEPAPPMIYVPAAQDSFNSSTAWVIRARNGLTPEAALRRAVAQIDPAQRVLRVQSLSNVAAASAGRPNFETLLLTVFAVLALVLTSVGFYGVLSFHVSQRTQEIGIRIALGAPARQVVGQVVAQGLRLMGFGAAIGLAGAYGLTRTLRGMLFGVGPTDPTTFGAVLLVLAVVALLACWLPARRAARIDPLEALRYE